METTIWEKYKDQGVKVIAIDSYALDVSKPTEVADYVQYLGPTYPVGTENTEITYSYGDFSAHYEGSNPFPIDVIVDKNGIIQYIAREYDSAAMQAKIDELLAAP